MVKRISLILGVAVVALLSVALFNNFRASALSTAPTNGPADPMVASLTSQLATGDAMARAEAATALSGSEDPVATTALLANLGDTDPAAGYNTAMALGQSNSPAVADALIAELSNENEMVRTRAAIALNEMRAPQAVPALAASLNDGAVSMIASEALVRVSTPEAHDALLEALADKELTTRRHAAMAAIEHADPVTIQSILGRALASDDLVLVSNARMLSDMIGTN